MGSQRQSLLAAAALLALTAPAAAEVVEVPVEQPQWQTVLTLEGLRRSQYVWTAKVRNAHNDPRKICVAFDLLDASKLVVSTSVRCIVVPPRGEATVDGDAYVEMSLLDRVKTHQATATSNPIYYPSTPQRPAP